MRFFLTILCFLILPATYCQPQKTISSSEIFLQLKKLNVLGSVLYIAAHPDDENNALLPYLTSEKYYRAAYLSLTRGDGGQNLIGDEQGVELGMIRTNELLAARSLDGAEQYFTRAYEFGYSKSAEEALGIWDKEKILSDVVWVIRQFQPDVIIKRFPPDARAGHGHHAASSIIADEAFTAAADPKRFPEQLALGVKAWQAKRILWNTYNFGNTNTTSEDQLRIDIGMFNPLLGKGYGEIGADARTMHKSQGEGRPARRGQLFEYFSTTGGSAPATGMMDGVITGWERIKGGEKIHLALDTIITNYALDQPELSVPGLVDLYLSIQTLPASEWTRKKLAELQQIIGNCSGLYLEVTSSQQTVVQGDTLRLSVVLNKRKEINATLKNIRLENFDSAFALPLITNQTVIVTKNIRIANDKNISQPYWLQYPFSGGMFEVKDQAMIGKAMNDPAFQCLVGLTIGGEDFLFNRPVQYRFVDLVKGELYQPVAVLPKVEMAFKKDNFISLNNSPVNVQLSIKSNTATDVSSIQPHLDYPKNWTWRKADERLHFTLNPQKEKDWYGIFSSRTKETNITNEITAAAAEGNYDGSFKTITYDHIPAITWFPRAKANLVKLDIKILGKRIGYFIGAGDKVPAALEGLGYEVRMLFETDINDATLSGFDAIVTGVRAYNLSAYLSNNNDVFMRYVSNGGKLIVQYLRSSQAAGKKLQVGPYPFTVNPASRVSEENAPVNFLLPNHPVLNHPNKITAKDFEGWVQERSTYQAEQLDEHYETPLGMNDAGQKESNGSLLITKYGKGYFVYSSLAFFRQLPAGVPGAYRLMANLIALGSP